MRKPSVSSNHCRHSTCNLANAARGRTGRKHTAGKGGHLVDQIDCEINGKARQGKARQGKARQGKAKRLAVLSFLPAAWLRMRDRPPRPRPTSPIRTGVLPVRHRARARYARGARGACSRAPCSRCSAHAAAIRAIDSCRGCAATRSSTMNLNVAVAMHTSDSSPIRTEITLDSQF